MPNHPRFPAVLHCGAVPTGGDAAAALEALFARNGWPPQWRDGISVPPLPYPRARGARDRSRQRDGPARRPGGREVALAAGDVVVLPAGTGHCRIPGERRLPGGRRLPARPVGRHLPRRSDAGDAGADRRAGGAGDRPGRVRRGRPGALEVARRRRCAVPGGIGCGAVGALRGQYLGQEEAGSARRSSGQARRRASSRRRPSRPRAIAQRWLAA